MRDRETYATQMKRFFLLGLARDGPGTKLGAALGVGFYQDSSSKSWGMCQSYGEKPPFDDLRHSTAQGMVQYMW